MGNLRHKKIEKFFSDKKIKDDFAIKYISDLAIPRNI